MIFAQAERASDLALTGGRVVRVVRLKTTSLTKVVLEENGDIDGAMELGVVFL